MHRKILLTAGLVLAAGEFTAKADTITYDATLASPNANPVNGSTNPSWYNGSGNAAAQGGFTIDNGNGVELGLRAKYRQNPNVIHTANNVYNVVAGPQTVTTTGGQPGNAARTAWNYEFSIDLQAGGPTGTNSGLTLSQVVANSILKITDLDTSAFIVLNPFTSFNDDSLYGPGGKHDVNIAGNPADAQAHVLTDWGAKNSENPVFAGTMPAGYDMNNGHRYEVELDIINSDHNTLASDTIEINVAPLPSSATAGLAMIGGLGLVTAAKHLRRTNVVA